MYALIMTLVLFMSHIATLKKKECRRIYIYVTTLVCFIYILWRIKTIPIQYGLISFILGILLFLAELLGLIAFLNFSYLFTEKYKIKQQEVHSAFGFSDTPFVDVLICTYNEPLYLLEKTMAACTNLDYPEHKICIHVCDDGRRNELKELCKEYNINYITREDNKGAKAGNINNALKQLKGDLFAVFDADMIPKKEFLIRTVGYFVNENLSFVQVPQVYYNKDPYQYNLNKNIPNEQDFFMRDIQEARAAKNAVLHVGTNAVFRRKYVNEIGGYPTCSITEDMAVGMLLQSKGYDSLLINEELVLGLSATTFPELIKQRDRWCRGNIQVFKKYNPLFTKGLTLAQKIAYFDGTVYWFSNLQKMIYILCPIIYLLTRKMIIDCHVGELLNIYIPYITGQALMFKTLSPGNRKLKWAHYYDVAMSPHLTLSIFKEMLGLSIKFNVTDKDIRQDKSHFYFKAASFHIAIIVITIVAWIVSLNLILSGQMCLSSYLLNMLWSGYNLLGVLVCIKICHQKPIYSNSERINIYKNTILDCSYNNKAFKADLIDISESGVALKPKDNIDLKVGSVIKIDLINQQVEAKVVRITKDLLGLAFNNINAAKMKEVMQIFTDNMRAHYNLNKTQEYIIDKKHKTINAKDIFEGCEDSNEKVKNTFY